MKLKYRFIKRNVDNTTIAICVDSDEFSGMLKLNETASFIFNLLSEDIDEEEVIKKVSEEYGVSTDGVRDDVLACLNNLREAGILID